MFSRGALQSVRLLGCGLVLLSTSMLLGPAFPVGAAAQTAPAAPRPSPTADAHPEFPSGPGRETTLKKCSQCHSPNNILAQGRDRQGWEDLITKMVGFGASGTDEEFSDILDYVTKNFPPTSGTHVNINTADATQIAAALTLTPDEAKAIVDYREKNGKFKSFDDLKKVPTLDAKKLDAKKDAIQL